MRAATASPERTGLWHAHAPPRATAQAPSATVSRSGDVRSVPAFLTAGTWAHMHGSRRGGAHPFSGLVDVRCQHTARSGSATRGRVRGTHLPSPLRVVDALAVLACPRRVCRVRVGRAVLHSNTTRWPRAGAQSWARGSTASQHQRSHWQHTHIGNHSPEVPRVALSPQLAIAAHVSHGVASRPTPGNVGCRQVAQHGFDRVSGHAVPCKRPGALPRASPAAIVMRAHAPTAR